MNGSPKAPKLRVSNVQHEYGTLKVLDGISFDVEAGQFITLVGGSGSGKTTLLRIISQLIKPSSGCILVDGQPPGRPGEKMAFVFQQDALLPWRTVIANASYGLELRGVRRQQARERAAPYLDLVGLGQFKDYFPHQLSGGMRQRVNLARALTVEPEILLMDEPFAALDAQTRELMQFELLRIWREAGKTVLFVTHQLDEAVFLADRVIALSARPGSVREIIEIDIARPREIDVKRTEQFQHFVGHLWRLIEADVRRGFEAAVDQVN